MVKISDIVEKTGVSKSTVSKALNGGSDISETLRNKILATAEEMGYQKTNVKKIAIFIQNTAYTQEDDFGYDLIEGFRAMMRAAKQNRFEITIVDVDEALQASITFDAYMKKNKFIACFVIGFSYYDIWLPQCKESKYPSVLYDNQAQGAKKTSQVGVDNDEAMDMLVSHLVELGHKKFAYLSGELGAYYATARYASFRKALEKYNIPFSDEFFGEDYYVSLCVSEHLPQMLDRGATAVVCGHDMLANAALLHCREMGFQVPTDVSVVGFDNLKLANFTVPPLTTIYQNRYQIGQSAYYALESLLNDVPVNVVYIHSQLVVRNSTTRAKER